MSAENISVDDWPISQYDANAKRALAAALGVQPTSITSSVEVDQDEIRISWTRAISRHFVEDVMTTSKATESGR